FSLPSLYLLLFLFFLLPLPPCSILFPYTTLFRSYVHPLSFCAKLFNVKNNLIHNSLDVIVTYLHNFHKWHEYVHHHFLYNEPSLDRKSTRLNSSHVSISYAVFCLKKKISNHNIDV